MKKITDICRTQERPVRVLQFGEGAFLRAFADEMIDQANVKGVFDGGIAIVKPRRGGDLERFRSQKGLYTLISRGISGNAEVDESRIVKSVSQALHAYDDYERLCDIMRLDTLQFVISNTTEAGIVFDENDRFEDEPPESFPGKLTKLLYLRWQAFGGDGGRGLIMLPTELIEGNGARLRDCVVRLSERWGLEAEFLRWIKEDNIFCDTLVDRIVTGYPKEEAAALCERLGYEDGLIDVAEPFGLWVIASERIAEVREKLPLDRAGLPVVFTGDAAPYRERKVRVLNGAHTSMALAAYLAGFDTVGECMNDPVMREYIEHTLFGEIVPFVSLLGKEAAEFAHSVLERFANPFLRHRLLSIALNSVSKWRARVLPSVLDYYAKEGRPPELLTFSFAALAEFYTAGERGGVKYEPSDDAAVLEFFGANRELSARGLIEKLAAQERFWGMALGEIDGFIDKASESLGDIRENGAAAAIKRAAGRRG